MRKSMYKVFVKYLEQHQKSHYYYVLSFVAQEANALDVLQESILKGLRQIDHLKEVEKMNPWFYRIMRNTSIDFLRRSKRVTVVDFKTMETSILHEDHYEDVDLTNALKTLTREEKELVELKYGQGFTFREISQLTDLPESTVKTRTYRILNQLKQLLTLGDTEVRKS